MRSFSGVNESWCGAKFCNSRYLWLCKPLSVRTSSNVKTKKSSLGQT